MSGQTGLSNVNSYKTIKNMTSITRGLGTIVADSLSVGNVNATSLFTPQLEDNTFSNIVIENSVINSTIIGNESPLEATFRKLTVGFEGRGEDVIFYGQDPGKFLYWDAAAGTLFLTGTLNAPDVSFGNLNIDGNSIFPKNVNGGVELAVQGQERKTTVTENTISFLGPIDQYTDNGDVNFRVCNPSNQMRFRSANTFNAISAKSMNMQTNYGSINLQTGVEIIYTIASVSFAQDNYAVVKIAPFDSCMDMPARMLSVGDNVLITGASVSLLNSTYSVLSVVSDTDLKINLLANSSIQQANVMANVGGTFKRTNLSTANINLSPSGNVYIPQSTSLYFNTNSERIFATSNELNLIGSNKLVFTSPVLSCDTNSKLIWSNSSFVQGSSSYLNIYSSGTSNFSSSSTLSLVSDNAAIEFNARTFVKFVNNNVPVYIGSASDAYLCHTDSQFVIQDLSHEIMLNTNRIKLRQDLVFQFDVTETTISRNEANEELIIKNRRNANLSKIVLDAPTTYVTGNLQVQGESTVVNSTVVTIKDPVMSIGSNTTPRDTMDRGIRFLYDSNKIGFFGWKNTNGRFSFIPNTTSTTGEVYLGPVGDFEMSNLFVNSINALNGTTLEIKGGNTLNILDYNSIQIPTNTRMYFDGSGNQVYITSDSSQNVVVQSPGYMYISSGHISMPHNTFIRAINSSGEVEIQNSLVVDRIRLNNVVLTNDNNSLELANLSSITVPNSVQYRWADGSYLSSNSDILTIHADSEIRLTAPITVGEYRASIIALAYGGTAKGSWLARNIPFLNADATAMTESSNLQYDSSLSRMRINNLTMVNNKIDADSGIVVIEPVTMNKTLSRVNVAGDLYVNDDIFVNNNLYFGEDGDSKKIYNDDSNSNLVFKNSSNQGYFDFQNAAGLINTADSKITINNDLKVLYGNKLFFGDAVNYIRVGSSGPLEIASAGDIVLRPQSKVVDLLATDILKLGSATLSGDASTFTLTLRRHLYLDGSDSTIYFTNSNTFIRSVGNNQLEMKTRKFIIDGDLEVYGKVQNSIIQTAIVDSNFVKIGQGKYVNIVSVEIVSSEVVSIVIDEDDVAINVGEEVQIIDTNFKPNIDGQHLIINKVANNTFQIRVPGISSSFDVYDIGNGKVRLGLDVENSRDVGVQLNYFAGPNPKKAFMFFQNQTNSFVLANSGTNNLDVIDVLEKGTLRLGSLVTDTISGCQFVGETFFGNNRLNSANVNITGGSINNFTTSTLAQVDNLNSNYLQGYLANNFVFRDGSLALTSNWDAGNFYIEANTFRGKDFHNTAVAFVDSTTKALKTNSGFFFRDQTSTLVSNIDVSANSLTLRDEQIQGSKVTGFSPNLNIGGNAATVTNGVYTTDYNTNTILKSDVDNTPTALEITENSIVGRPVGGVISGLSPLQIRTIADVPQVGFVPMEEPTLYAGAVNPDLSVSVPLSFVEVISNIPSVSEAVVNLPNASKSGQFKMIVACNGTGLRLRVRCTIISAEGVKATKDLVFENAGQSVHLVWYDKLKAWFVVNSGCFIQ